MVVSRIVIVRHAEAFHNLPRGNGDNIRDPYLTPRGIEQCRDLSRRLPEVFGDLTKSNLRIFSSPMKRTLYSAYFTFKELLDDEDNQLTVEMTPSLQEVGLQPAHIGSSKAALIREFVPLTHRWCQPRIVPPGHPYQLADDWNVKDDTVRGGGITYGNSDAALRDRAATFRRRMKELNIEEGETTVVVFTHGLFIPYLINDTCEYSLVRVEVVSCLSV